MGRDCCDGDRQPIPAPDQSQRAAASDNPPWVTELKKVFGWHEVRDNLRLRTWLKSDNKTLGHPQALPWRGDAVETAVKLALPDEPFTGNVGINPYYARNWTGLGSPRGP